MPDKCHKTREIEELNDVATDASSGSFQVSLPSALLLLLCEVFTVLIQVGTHPLFKDVLPPSVCHVQEE